MQFQQDEAPARMDSHVNEEQDRFYVQAKIMRLRSHAEKVRDALIDKKSFLLERIQKGDPDRIDLEAEAIRTGQGIDFTSRVRSHLAARP